ncbi:hypothetical protein ACRALDRAFT_2021233 [Sodiomyces alcalophilus JCM 7366]|uniref:uncharacterized protein n=1 Tax=Sodiomyces alcalophilus JCM 7366 TaxID=591952 RepID=UPI0039B4E252
MRSDVGRDLSGLLVERFRIRRADMGLFFLVPNIRRDRPDTIRYLKVQCGKGIQSLMLREAYEVPLQRSQENNPLMWDRQFRPDWHISSQRRCVTARMKAINQLKFGPKLSKYPSRESDKKLKCDSLSTLQTRHQPVTSGLDPTSAFAVNDEHQWNGSTLHYPT